MSGQAYATTDIDGIFGGSAETYTRDLQWKCFTPAMYVMNGWSHKPKSPWAYEEPYRSINRKFLKQKLRLTPYMYTYCYEAWLTGAPIVRPMVWNYPDDQYTWDDKTQYQFMLGEDFLVAPVYTSLKVNKGWRKGGIYLPEGIWIDYNDGRRVIGPTIIEAYPITLETIPIFVRAGAIIPMYPETLYSDQVIKDTLTLDIYADASGSFTLYEDDGNTRKYQEGEYTLQTFTFENMGDSFTLQINGAEGTAYDNCCEQRAYDLKFHTQQQPKMVVVDGKEIFAITSTNAPERVYANSRECWYYDANDRYGVLHVKLGKRGIDQGVTVFAMLSDDEIAATPPYPVPEITNDLDKSLFVVTCNSQSGGNTIQNAFDGSEDTIWHSNYSKNGVTNFPYIIDIDISQLAPLTGVQYLPRSNLGNGTLKDYEIYVSRTKGVFGEPVAKGAFEAFTNATAQKIEFPITWGRYVRFKALSSQSGNQYGSAAEIDILQDITAEPLPDETTPIAKIEPAKVTGTIARDKGLKGDKLRVDNTDWTTGITVQVGSEIIYTLDGTWEKVLGHAGMEDAQGDGGNVTFRIFADDKMIFERLGMNGSQVKQLIDVEIPEGAKQLRFTLTQEPGGADSDTGVWTDLRFFRAGSKR